MIRRAAFGAWLVLHRVATIAIGAALILMLLLAGFAWRLSQGPVDLEWLTHRLEAAVNGNGGNLSLSIGHTALVWEGFRLGVDRPLDLRLTNVQVTANGAHRVVIPRAEVSLALFALLHGRIQPRALELDDARLTLRRARDGAISVDLGSAIPSGSGPAAPTVPGAAPPVFATAPPPTAPPPTAPPVRPEAGPVTEPLPSLLALLAQPPAAGTHVAARWFSQLRRVRIHNAAVTVIDRRLGVDWAAPQADITLRRNPRGGIAGTVDLSLALGRQRARLTAAATVSPDATATQVTARLSPVQPAALAQAAPALHFLAAVDAPVTADASADLTGNLQLRQARLSVRAGPGSLHLGGAVVPMAGADVVAIGTLDSFRVDEAELRLRPQPLEAPTTLTATGTVQRQHNAIAADFSLGLDQVSFADLPSLWPPDMAHDARAWITRNITAGMARNGSVAIGLAGPPDLSKLTVTRLSGSLQATGLTVWWLRPVPPIVNGSATLRFIDPDTVQIDVASGQEVPDNGGALTIDSGTMRIAGLSRRDQTSAITAQISGSLADTLAFLSEPRLQLLSRHPFKVNDPAGQVSVGLTVTLPLDKSVQIDDVAIKANAQIMHAFLGGVVAGRDLSHGTLALRVDNDGLTVRGAARIAGIPASLDAMMDFRAGPPTQVVQRFAADGRADATQLAAAGLDARPVLSGPVGLHAVLTEQRSGVGTVDVAGNLTDAVLAVKALDWRKPAGQAANATAVLLLDHDRLDRIDPISVTGPGLLVRAAAAVTNRRISHVQLNAVTLGRSRMQGSVSLPASPGDGPIAVRLTGPVLDLAPRLEEPTVKTKPHRPPAAQTPGPPWTLDARFDRVLMAHGYLVAPLTVQADNDGLVFRHLAIAGFTRPDAPFAVKILTEGGRRHLTVTAARTGDLLRALDVTSTMQDGNLAISGTYNDATTAHLLRGTVDLKDFRVSKAAALGKLLQAMTLYGLVDALRGPGLGFSRLVAPFTFSDGLLELHDARAFSPSLGLTVKGAVDLDANTADLKGTIVPAYFFNSLLGDVPLVGRLFSPERGGGVFAASYGLRGDMDDPTVSINPLTALTPGFLRGLFGIL